MSCKLCGWPDCDRPPCACGESCASSPGGRCRDCDIRHGLDSMQCSVCKRMRYRQDAGLGQYLWGDPCVCDPPSVAEATSL